MDPREAFGIMLMLLAASTPILIIGIVAVIKKRFEHKQIMAAIEKGIPLSEIMPPKQKLAGPPWIRFISMGVGLLAFAVTFMVIGGGWTEVVLAVLFAVGLAWIVRGLLHRKYQLQNNLSTSKNTTAENKNPPGIA